LEKTYCPVPNFNNENSEFGTSKCMGGKCGVWVWKKDNQERFYRDESIILQHAKDCKPTEGHFITVKDEGAWFSKPSTRKIWVEERCSCPWYYEEYPEEYPDIKIDEQGMCGLKLSNTKS